MRWDAKEGLTHDNKCRDIEDGVGGQIMEVQPVVEHKSMDELVERESQPADKVRDERLGAGAWAEGNESGSRKHGCKRESLSPYKDIRDSAPPYLPSKTV